MKIATRITATLTIGLGSVFMFGCPGAVSDSTDDLTTPAPCTSDSDCPDGIACVDGDTDAGFCDIDETDVTNETPAPCTTDEDCLGGVACINEDGSEQGGFCDVDEMLIP